MADERKKEVPGFEACKASESVCIASALQRDFGGVTFILNKVWALNCWPRENCTLIIKYFERPNDTNLLQWWRKLWNCTLKYEFVDRLVFRLVAISKTRFSVFTVMWLEASGRRNLHFHKRLSHRVSEFRWNNSNLCIIRLSLWPISHKRSKANHWITNS